MIGNSIANTHSSAIPLPGKVVRIESNVTSSDTKELLDLVSAIRKKERKFIGQELHDNVNQLLSAVKIMLEMQRPAMKRDEELRSRSLDLVLQAINEIRELSFELVTNRKEMEGLKQSVSELIRDLQFPDSVHLNFKFDDWLDQLDESASITLYRIAQEHLKNVALHSQAKNLEIIIQRTLDKKIMMIIKDDGKGFDPLKKKRGIGLSNISDRAISQGGTATIQSSPGKGCILLVTIPAVIA